MSKKIRKADYSDIDRIFELNKQHGSDSFSRAMFNKRVNNSTFFYVIEIDNKIVGYYLALTRVRSSIIRLYSICVDKNYHNKGIGKEMLRHLCKLCCNISYTQIKLEVSVNNKAQYLYIKEGFEPFKISSKYYRDGSDAIFMKKSIPPRLIY